MADTTISNLTAVSAAATTNELPVNEAGASKKVTLTQFQSRFAATLAEAQAGTTTTRFITPLNKRQHPSEAKFWVKATGNSTTILASYNMTSWADTAVGQATGTIATNFTTTNWAGKVSIHSTSGASWTTTYSTYCGLGTKDGGTFRVDSSRMTDGGTSVSELIDPGSWFAVGFGVI